MTTRLYTCIDCGRVGQAGRAGPVPQRCNECKREHSRRYQKERYNTDPEHRERRRLQHREWRERNAEHLREYERSVWQAKKNDPRARERKREADRRYYERNRDRHRALMRAYAEKNQEQIREYRRAYYEERKEWFRERSQKNYAQAKADYIRRAEERRARKRAATVERVERVVVWDRDQGVCHICGKGADPTDWHMDHIVPLIAGGAHAYDNVAVSHPRCNRAKGASVA